MYAPHKFWLGLNGETLGYFVPSDEWDFFNNYEETVSIGKTAADNIQAALKKVILEEQT
jgi:hypothetical protein